MGVAELGVVGIMAIIAAVTGGLNLLIMAIIGYMIMKALAFSVVLGGVAIAITLVIFLFQLWKHRKERQMVKELASAGLGKSEPSMS